LSIAIFPLRLQLCVHYQGHRVMQLGAAADYDERATVRRS
jgi:hypothetical protein